jgi:NAD+ kinase
MKTFGLVANLEKENVLDLVEMIVKWMEDNHCRPVLSPAVADILRLHQYSGKEFGQEKIDCLIVLGGDGTLLSSARRAALTGTPILGINIGRIGFLTEVEEPNIIPAMEKLLRGEYTIEKRMMLEAKVYRGGVCVEDSIALNDAVITKGGFARLIFLETYVNDEYVANYPADGLIIASPTGSTAYSLSAGGPLITPALELMLITPICPHSLWARPLVIDAQARIKVNLHTRKEEATLTMDGQYAFKLEQNDTVIITRSPFQAKFIRLKKRTFYYLYRTKLSEGEKDNPF